jgi:hypothetical protein
MEQVQISMRFIHEQAFDSIKKFIEIEVLLCYPDFNKDFRLSIDLSDHLVGTINLQD